MITFNFYRMTLAPKTGHTRRKRSTKNTVIVVTLARTQRSRTRTSRSKTRRNVTPRSRKTN